MTRKKTPLPDEDRRLWQRFTQDITPLSPAVAQKSATADTAIGLTAAVSPPARRPKVRGPAPAPAKRHQVNAPQELIPGKIINSDKATARRVKRGKQPIDARIDLHGMDQTTAYMQLTGFISRAVQRNFKTVLVVTGKGAWREGGGVLKREVPRWLNEQPLRSQVLSFSHATREDGGDGALIILLKTRKRS